MPDGTPRPVTDKELAKILKGEPPTEADGPDAPPEPPKTVPLTPEEKAVLTGLIAARTAVAREIEGYMVVVSSRLGLARNRVADANIQTGLVTLASDAPKAAETTQ